ncbi:23 kDa integral membrane protein-like [Vespa velutina]|uniref:23 kDa integral membrane protein-like n=1 Tax=Vespa velutina TaxID=202808 RepID=UPI001FB237D9|nr:23 kDa integral membrane protein-like [Vespa velutina]
MCQKQRSIYRRKDNEYKMADKVTIMKTLLVFFSCIFWATGMLIVGASILIRFKFEDYYINNPVGGRTMILALAILGIVWMLSAQFGCCSTILKHSGLIYLYGAFLTTILLLELGAITLIYICIQTINERLISMSASDPNKIYTESCCQIIFRIVKSNVELTDSIIIGLLLFPIIGACLTSFLVDMINIAEIERRRTDRV